MGVPASSGYNHRSLSWRPPGGIMEGDRHTFSLIPETVKSVRVIYGEGSEVLFPLDSGGTTKVVLPTEFGR